ncbi:MAG: Ig-like domain repeat protein, partial [Edaphobacter sp.]
GNITTVAGTGTQGFSGDNGLATTARLDSPQGLALGAGDSLYIADTHNHRVRKLDLASGLITTIAGTTAGFSGDNGPATAARLDLPTALAVDANGNVYVADTQNYRIRKIAAASGILTTVAGNGVQGFSGDNGPATAAAIDSPSGLAIDAAGDLYFSDTHNHRVRRIAAATGIISTIAGTGTAGYSGDSSPGTAARLALPGGLSIDSAGNLYIADTGNQRIRRIDAITGAITTVAGNGTQTFSGDDGAATIAALDSPRSTTVSPAGRLTLADTGNQRVRQLDAQTAPAIHTIVGLSSAVGDVLSLTASSTIVYGAAGQVTASLISATAATGSLTFTLFDAAAAVAATVTNVPLVDDAAVFDGSTLSTGSYSLIAAYTGDSTHPATQSPPLAFRIVPRTLIVAPDPVVLLYGQPIPTLTGTVTGLLPQDDSSLATRFTASVPASSPPAAYPISASISGSAANNYSLSLLPTSLTIKPAPTVTTLDLTEGLSNAGTPVTLTTHVDSTTTGTPSGTMTLMDGSTSLQALRLASGNATFITNALAPGVHSLTTLYGGDTDFTSSASSPALITVISAPSTRPDFTLATTGTATQTIPSGGSANFNFSLQIQGAALSSPITLAATGLPALATASFNPAYLPPGATPSSFVMTINTPQAVASYRNSRTGLPLFALLLFPVTGIVVRLRRSGKPALRLAVSMLAAVALTLCSGCGSRIGTGSGSANLVKTYTITVTGTATSPDGSILEHSTTVQLLIDSVTGGAS